ncbi:AraC family transcriptional regulator ligand-binding domain-containing protein [Oceanicoccus sp. KOV_DT_Chl]|uniref:AraC family transcriptional regulator ligand-binding domain-containing protein n=1 Tax=Oceanicoccus sp. KOV_DT_Chl TaxID=1904639 RepID=UPI000C7B1D7C|nr:AraC family transcriptional regulator ligand-binding domain-containing protein [Oceanicoccus sp. KOV_DT_Chl]
MQDISIHIVFVKAVLKHAHTQGHDLSRLLRRSRISPRLLNEPHARVGAEQFAKLQTVTMREMGDEMLGYCARPIKIGQWSILCHWLIQSKTLGQALKRCCLFYSILEHGFQPKLSIRGLMPLWKSPLLRMKSLR